MNKVNNVFEHTDCLSDDMLVKYVSGKLSPAEKHKVEKHLVDCEMCSDTVEGLSTISDKNKIPEITSELNQKIQNKVEKKKEVKVVFIQQYRTQLAVAASIFLVIGLVWFFRNNMSMKEMDSTSSEKIFADKFVPPPSEKLSESKEEIATGKEQDPADANRAVTTVQEPSPKVTLDEAEKKVVLNDAKAGKDVSGGEKLSWAENKPVQKTDQTKTGIPREEKTEDDNRSKNAEVTTKGNATTTAMPDAKFRDENIVLLSKDVSKNQNELIPQKDNDKKEEAKKPESAPSMTATGAAAGAYDQSAAYKSLSFAKQENKKTTADRERAQSQDGDMMSLESAKKTKHKARKDEKEAAPAKATDGFYESIATAPPQSQTISQQSNINGKLTDSVSVSAGLTISDVTTVEATPSDNAMAKYDKQDYGGAVTDFEQTLKQNPSDEKALFYSAVSYLSLGQPDKAISNLNKVLQNKNSKYFDDAQWYLSLSYIKKKDAQNARKNLMEIQNNSKSKYQKQADETLKEMNK